MFWDKLRSLFFLDSRGASPQKINKNLLILLAVGIGLLLFNSLFQRGDGETPELSPAEEDLMPSPFPEGEKEVIDEITRILNQIDGIDSVSVYLTLESGSQKELAQNRDMQERTTTEEDAQGGSRIIEEKNLREDYVIIRDPQGGEKPLVLVEHHETYRGVLVVARGVEDSRKKAEVIEALQTLLGLSAHRITVLPRGD